MDLCIAKNKKGIPCTKRIYEGSHLQRTCTIHLGISLVTRPDITEPPTNPPPRNSKIDPYAIHNCLVVGCNQPNILGEFVCTMHEYCKNKVKSGIEDERHNFTPYYQQLVLQQDLRLNDPEYQERVRQDKARFAQLERYRYITFPTGARIQRSLSPYYITQCCFTNEEGGPRCNQPNRFGCFTCETHKHYENLTNIRWESGYREYTRRYQDLLFEEMNDPRQNDAEFQERIRQHKEQPRERIQQYW